jgi:hypothetical protein
MSGQSPSASGLGIWLSAGSILIASCSAFASWLSFRTARRALYISENQEARKKPHLKVYFANGYRLLVSDGQIFAFLVSVSNPTDIDNSIFRAELRVSCQADHSETIIRLSHEEQLASAIKIANENLGAFALPARIDAHQTLSGWFLFKIPNSVLGERTVADHTLILEDTHGATSSTDSIMVRAWHDETAKTDIYVQPA